jgi:IS5 family transposase
VRAVRIDSTVIEADVKYPTDAGLAGAGVRALAREGKKLAALVGEQKWRVCDRSRSMGRTLRGSSRTIRRRSGEAKSEVLKLTAQTGRLLERSIRETRRLAAIARRKARGRGAKAKLRAAAKLEQFGRPVREGRRGFWSAATRRERSTTSWGSSARWVGG